MTDPLPHLTAALSDRYRIERELGAGGMATVLAAESRGSADVAKAADLFYRRSEGHFSDTSRAVALATSER